ncbi:hypothetical protein CY34DRAFT_11528 [Suillus luteus UH-Slu-Lm8-n1]|uniref:Uncharacterized protein n=1 Tax=Suillus luteus UH-Slu-Lm8-n1 TaxID=930992 RepID=A0A0D0B164_9AGAM|nr:hypothetical protein CY34DRAFT_11528 [Suillus luteus UH-Slu-Lm8-n1]
MPLSLTLNRTRNTSKPSPYHNNIDSRITNAIIARKNRARPSTGDKRYAACDGSGKTRTRQVHGVIFIQPGHLICMHGVALVDPVVVKWGLLTYPALSFRDDETGFATYTYEVGLKANDMLSRASLGISEPGFFLFPSSPLGSRTEAYLGFGDYQGCSLAVTSMRLFTPLTGNIRIQITTLYRFNENCQ